MWFRSKNTPTQGRFRYIIFHDHGTWYGVALEFNLVVDADTREAAYDQLLGAAQSYIMTVRQHHLRDLVLNQNTSSEYSKLWRDLEQGRTPSLESLSEERSSKPVAVTVDSYGFFPQPA